MEDFRVVSRKKSKKMKQKENHFLLLQSKISDIRFEMSSQPFLAEALAAVRSSLEIENTSSGQGAESTGSDDTAVHLVCYGLGNFVDSYIARYQLYFLLALREEFKVSADHCEVYDPQFSEDEIGLLQQLDCTVLDQNQEGKFTCQAGMKTVFFMPHCGKALYNNVLWANWGRTLQDMIIIGNSFSQMIERTPERILKRTGNYILKIKDFTCERPFPGIKDNEAIFNDTSVHSFLCGSDQAPTSLWEENTEPVYDPTEAEIVFS